MGGFDYWFESRVLAFIDQHVALLFCWLLFDCCQVSILSFTRFLLRIVWSWALSWVISRLFSTIRYWAFSHFLRDIIIRLILLSVNWHVLHFITWLLSWVLRCWESSISRARTISYILRDIGIRRGLCRGHDLALGCAFRLNSCWHIKTRVFVVGSFSLRHIWWLLDLGRKNLWLLEWRGFLEMGWLGAYFVLLEIGGFFLSLVKVPVRAKFVPDVSVIII